MADGRCGWEGAAHSKPLTQGPWQNDLGRIIVNVVFQYRKHNLWRLTCVSYKKLKSLKSTFVAAINQFWLPWENLVLSYSLYTLSFSSSPAYLFVLFQPLRGRCGWTCSPSFTNKSSACMCTGLEAGNPDSALTYWRASVTGQIHYNASCLLAGNKTIWGIRLGLKDRQQEHRERGMRVR